ncbi:tol-pal system protein YbgF [Desulfacinum hydrothermale DSM 13146]|uniref:Tol-pal system protein YbgF n=1 Tax=Desulfacinum hydrothermale DSM 13146 TaxID=1121390 RepID=A0A1W1X2Q5_9BACT|nr:tol-pal system protein YbgF [Desulfacinum hydrothermale]SMC18103.1 tol-pal system protein YbgF [Desulfacinum hydrothermale DSM 13146]
MTGRMRALGGAAVAALTLILLQGCVTTQQTSLLQQSVYSLQQQVQDLDSRVQRVESAVFGTGEGQGPGRRSLAEMNARLDALKMEVAKLKGQLEEQQRAAAPIPAPTAAPASATPAPSGTTGSQAGVQIVTPPQDPEKALYSRSLESFQKGDYENALKGFRQFVDRYPQSDLADNALFWIGECHFMKGRYQEAIAAYQDVLDRYPKGNKVAYALLKQGAAFEKLGDKTAARILYERVIQQHPQTPQAEIAKKWLERVR